MIITYLGHAGFCVETKETIIIMDPWLSPYGAFDSAWFQYPKNHHMGDYVRDLMNHSPKKKYIYISHEHKDHFDLPFLKTIQNRDFSIILGAFHREIVKENLEREHYQCKEIISLKNNEELCLPDATITLFLIDAELESDSTILLQTKSHKFLNMNDCKLHEKLPEIINKYKEIDVFAAQYSGAIWHPTCYDYTKKQYEKISANKKHIKFELTARAIETLKPKFYFPSAGPACFLDPLLLPINFEKLNIFPRAKELIAYLDTRCKDSLSQWPEIFPGDTLDVSQGKFIKLAKDRVDEKDFKKYLKGYAKEYETYFHNRTLENNKINPEKVFLGLRADLEKKIDQLHLVHTEITTPLYWQIEEYPKLYCINFHEKTLSVVDGIVDANNFYHIKAPAWQVNKVLTKEMNWPDFALTFRVKLARNPDVYHTLIHGFLTLDAESLSRLCTLIKNFHESHERMIITVNGKRYSVLRFCKHQGADLKEGWLEKSCLVCPRHRWHYDILNEGKCTTNLESIEAICLDEDTNS